EADDIVLTRCFKEIQNAMPCFFHESGACLRRSIVRVRIPKHSILEEFRVRTYLSLGVEGTARVVEIGVTSSIESTEFSSTQFREIVVPDRGLEIRRRNRLSQHPRRRNRTTSVDAFASAPAFACGRTVGFFGESVAVCGTPPKYRLTLATVAQAARALSVGFAEIVGLITSSSHSYNPPRRKYTCGSPRARRNTQPCAACAPPSEYNTIVSSIRNGVST